MVSGALFCRRSNGIIRIGLNLSSLGPTVLTVENFMWRSAGVFSWTSSVHFYINDHPNVSSPTQSLPHLLSIGITTTLFLLLPILKYSVFSLRRRLKLSLNLTKTKFTIFHPRHKKVYVPLVENTATKEVVETKFFQCYYWSAPMSSSLVHCNRIILETV